MPARLHAVLLLGWALLGALLRRLFARRRHGLAAFRAAYAADRLLPVSRDERAAIGSFGGCIACGRCDAGDARRIAASAGAYPGTMALVLASSRSLPDFDAAARAVALVTDEDLARKEGLCPTGVPLRRIAAFVRAKAAAD